MDNYLRTLDVVLGGISVILVARLIQHRKKANDLPLPPGPRRLPVIHNLLDLPKGFEPIHWAKHKDIYGARATYVAFGSSFGSQDPLAPFLFLGRRISL